MTDNIEARLDRLESQNKRQRLAIITLLLCMLSVGLLSASSFLEDQRKTLKVDRIEANSIELMREMGIKGRAYCRLNPDGISIMRDNGKALEVTRIAAAICKLWTLEDKATERVTQIEPCELLLSFSEPKEEEKGDSLTRIILGELTGATRRDFSNLPDIVIAVIDKDGKVQFKTGTNK